MALTNYGRKVEVVVYKTTLTPQGPVQSPNLPPILDTSTAIGVAQEVPTGTGVLVSGSNTPFGEPIRVQFKTSAPDLDSLSPPLAVIRLYNLADKTANLIQKEFNAVALQAGYSHGNYGIVFKGFIRQVKRGRLSALDSFVDIIAADSDYWWTWNVVTDSLSAKQGKNGILQEDIANKVVSASNGQLTKKTFDGQNTITGTGITNSGIGLPRGKVFMGLGKYYARQVARNTNSTFTTNNGVINFVSRNKVAPGNAIVLNSSSGMVGTPVADTDGIHVTSLLNPNISVGQQIQINNASLNTNGQNNAINTTIVKQYAPESPPESQFFARTSEDGFYRALVIEHEGDTRGQAWYTHLICLLLDSSTSTTVGLNQ